MLLLYLATCSQSHHNIRSSSAMADRPRELLDCKGVGQFEAKF